MIRLIGYELLNDPNSFDKILRMKCSVDGEIVVDVDRIDPVEARTLDNQVSIIRRIHKFMILKYQDLKQDQRQSKSDTLVSRKLDL
jgi:hypothetical protein